jgi:hypothetical protein
MANDTAEPVKLLVVRGLKANTDLTIHPSLYGEVADRILAAMADAEGRTPIREWLDALDAVEKAARSKKKTGETENG